MSTLLLTCILRCEASAFNDRERPPVYGQVLDAVEQYFMSGVTDPSHKVGRTSLPPLYFQHPGTQSLAPQCGRLA